MGSGARGSGIPGAFLFKEALQEPIKETLKEPLWGVENTGSDSRGRCRFVFIAVSTEVFVHILCTTVSSLEPQRISCCVPNVSIVVPFLVELII